jgi:hypothetical protein
MRFITATPDIKTIKNITLYYFRNTHFPSISVIYAYKEIKGRMLYVMSNHLNSFKEKSTIHN